MVRRKWAMVAALAGIVALAGWQHPSADIRILAHDDGDMAPRRVQAAVDTGIFAISLLVTWSRMAR